ncbi:MAG: T9SS type A sorting domain-containing protein [Bacteroidetes bacterium]|nr:T9SS type A sorting domain-containing protein [Bacteroidota bacterium]
MKTNALLSSTFYFLFSIMMILFCLGLNINGQGQIKAVQNNPRPEGKEPKVQQAFLPPAPAAENNQTPEMAVSNGPAMDIILSADPPSNAPLATITSTATGGNWNAGGTWVGGVVPSSTDNVVIASGATITLDGVRTCASLTINRPSAGNTNTLNINSNSLTCSSLTMSATTTARNSYINISSGTLTVTGTTTTGTTGCIITFTGAGTFTMTGALTGSPAITTFSGCNLNIGWAGTLTTAQSTAITTVAGSNFNYTSASAQTIYARTYTGNLGLSGAGTKTIAASTTVTVNGNITNSSTLVLTAGTSTASTWLVMGGNVTNTGTINATASYIRFIFSSDNAQTFTNNGTVTSPLSSFDVSNTNASGLTLAGTDFDVTRANLFTGSVINSNKITFGTGGTSYAVVQRGVAANTTPAGSFDVSPNINVSTGGLNLLYDNGSVAYNTGYEVPASLTCALFYIFDAADVTLNSDLTVVSELNFYGGTGTPTLRIDAHTLTLGGTITYTVAGAFYGGATSNLVMNGATTLNAVNNGLNNLTINANATLGGAVAVSNTLSLTSGILLNGANLTMASGSTIARSGGSLLSPPTFSGTVNLTYSGSSAINTGKELPSGSSVLNNLTTNAGGVTQYAYTSGTANLLNDVFPNLTSWTGNKGTAAGQFNSVATTLAGGTSPEADFIGAATHSASSTTYYIYRGPVNTTGYSSVNVSFKTSTAGTYTQNFPTYLKLQSATSASGPWHDVWSLPYAVLAAQTVSIPNYTTDVGGSMYFQFAYVGDYYATDHWYIDNLVVDGLTATPVSCTATINGTFDLTNGTYSIGAGNSLTMNGSISGNSAIAGSSTSNLSVGGSGSNLVIPSITTGVNDFTISRANGVTLKSDATVNGVLTLCANPSANHGCLDMLDGSTIRTLTMGASATTTGAGDVTGIVKRQHTFITSLSYSFGSQYTSLTFLGSGTKPTEVSCKIAIGNAPVWRSVAVKRYYSFYQSGGTDQVITNLRYLDSELNPGETDESKLVLWDAHGGSPWNGDVEPHGKSNDNTSENWVGLSGLTINYLAKSPLDNKQWGLGYSNLTKNTWLGADEISPTKWDVVANWSAGHVPLTTENVLIPAGKPAYPVLTLSVEVNSLEISSGASVDANSYNITLNGSTEAWDNQGTFTSGTGTVIFSHANNSEIVTMTGTTDFYNIQIGATAWLQLATGSHTGIAGAVTITSGGRFACASTFNTVEYNGTGSGQTVVNPNGYTPGYSNLILSGTTSKTMPITALSIADDFSMSGSALATANEALTIGGHITIGSGNTLNLSTFSHTFSGNLTNNGGTFTPSGSTVTLNGTAQQTITSSAGIAFNNLTITNTADEITLGTSTNCSIGGNLTIDAGAVFDLAANSLTAVTGSLSNSGTLKTGSSSSTPVPSGKTWGGLFEYTGSGAQTIVAGTYNNLTMIGSGGATASGNITVNGALNLSSANPTSAKGILDMGANTMLMGAAATTTGQGDVTGIVRRTSISPNTTYSFGNQYSTINFPNVGTLPSEISLKISIGAAPAWKTGAITRIYDLIQTGGSGTQAVLYCHYLDTELNGNDENLLVDWVHVFPSTDIEYGRSDYNTIDNWISIANVNVGVFSASFGAKEITLDESETLSLTWNGSTSTSWVTATNWTPNGAPSDLTSVTIPDAAGTDFDPTIPALARCGTLIIESGGILNASNGAQLTIAGAGGAWNNHGTFNPGANSTIVFTNANATMDGTSDLNNLTINTGAVLFLENNAYLGITGTVTNNGTWRTVIKGATTVEYKGGNQTVVVPNPATNRYYNLILSGSGTKTMPGTALAVYGDFTISGTATAIAGAALAVTGNLSIGSGAAFTAGTYGHSYAGFVIHSDVSGTGSLIANSSSFSGTVERYISHNLKWHFLSSPVTEQPVWPEFAPLPTANSFGVAPWNWDFYYWNPNASTDNELYWVNLRKNADGDYNDGTIDASGSNAGFGAATPDFTVGRGYLAAYDADYAGSTIHNFTGTLNYGNKSIAITSGINPWNLIGNPYPSAIDWRASGWDRSNLAENGGGGYDYWIFNGTSGNYGVFNSNDNDNTGTLGTSKDIAPMQAFFVQAATTGSISMTSTVQLHSTQSWLKETAGAENRLKIKLTSQATSYYDEMIVAVNSAFDNGGSWKFWSIYPEAPEIYAMKGGLNYSIDRLPSVNESSVISLGIKAGVETTYTLDATGVDNFYFAKSIILEDLKTGATQELKTNPSFTFSANPTDNPERFHLHFGGPYGIGLQSSQPDFTIFSFNHSVVIKNISGKNLDGNVTICNILGQKILQQRIIDQVTTLNLDAPAGCYIVTLAAGNRTYSKKLFIP